MGYTISVDIKAIEQLINALAPKDRLSLLRHIEENLWKSRIHKIVAEMRICAKNRGITDSEIDRICDKVRKNKYGKN